MARDETTPRHRRFGCFILPLAAIIGVVLGLCNLSYKSSYVAPGIYPTPDTSFIGRRTQVHLLREKADTAVIFIGGFGDQTTANFRCVYEGMPPLPGCGKQVRAYYAWDGAEGSLFELVEKARPRRSFPPGTVGMFPRKRGNAPPARQSRAMRLQSEGQQPLRFLPGNRDEKPFPNRERLFVCASCKFSLAVVS